MTKTEIDVLTGEQIVVPLSPQEQIDFDNQQAFLTLNSLSIAKTEKVQTLKAKFESIATSKPRVDSGLGYFVDGGRDNKDDFFSKWESMADTDVTTVRDADNQFHPNTTKTQMQNIYRAIVANGEALLQWKWQKEIEIANCTTLAQLDAVVL